MKVSNHGELRARKRLGINKRSVYKNFNDALTKGRQHNEFKGKFKKYLDHQAMIHHSQPFVYNNAIYWVRDRTLITVYPIPGMYKKYISL